MGDIADMMLDGTLCESCGVFLGEAVGYPQKCSSCAPLKSATKRRGMKDALIKIYVERFNAAGYAHHSGNGGVHLQVMTPKGRVDIWPTTNKWHIQSLNKKGFGIDDLMKELT